MATPSPRTKTQDPTCAPAHVVYYPSSELPLTPQEIAHELASLGKRDRLWLAIMQLLQGRLAKAVTQCADDEEGKLSPGHVSGRMAEITEIQQELKQYRDIGYGEKKKFGE